jgi:trans-2,3-dihydro-3-hydroxyanthranilate isomerase
MPEYAIKIVDAFTSRPYAGNPCGVVTSAEGLSDVQMQAVARELNLSETAFVFPSTLADFRVRFFTPATEIPLAGHPTIATMHALAEEGRIDLSGGPRRVTQEIKAGILPVDLAPAPGGLTRVMMTQATPVFGAQVPADRCALALGIQPQDLLQGVQPQVVSTGTPQAMVAVRSLEVLRRLRPDATLLAELEQTGLFFSTHVFALETFDPANRTHARHFAPNAGISEDPFTGSATGGMAAYLWKYGLVRDAAYTVEQGHIIGRPGVAGVEVDAEGETPVVVRVAGTAVTVLRGHITV